MYVEFMFACFLSSNPVEHVGLSMWESGVGQEARKFLRENDLVDHNNDPTSRGMSWVKYILETPLPEQVWRLPSR